MTKHSKRKFSITIPILLACPMQAQGQRLLPVLNLETEVTVSGLSSGAFMTVQIQTAFSSRISGAGVVAGGPFGCAETHNVYSSLYTYGYLTAGEAQATTFCLRPKWPVVRSISAQQEAEALQQVMDKLQLKALLGDIDPLGNMESDRIYLFWGLKDRLVRQETMRMLHDSYLALGIPEGNITYVESVEAGHAFLSDQGDVPCAQTEPDFINRCASDGLEGGPAGDQAHDILATVLPEMDWSDGSAPPPMIEDNLMAFNQAAYSDGAWGMDDVGFYYLPEICKKSRCPLHIALHGCKQGQSIPFGGDTMKKRYPQLTGYSRWAEKMGIVVLYPQARIVLPTDSNAHRNPDGCWDWWGYSSMNYLGKSAPQMAAIARMAEAMGAPLQ